MNKNKDKDEDFFKKVYSIVERIPCGKVTTYGSIANAIGIKSSARLVGWALNSAAGNPNLPCHRVINRNGELTGKRHFASPTFMRELLEEEGITFIDDAVDLKRHFWEAGSNC